VFIYSICCYLFLNSLNFIHVLGSATETIQLDLNRVLKVISSDPIEIIDLNSAELHIKQWVKQGDNSKRVELAAKAYKFYHRMTLIDIYVCLNALAVEKYPGQEKKQRAFERDLICAHQNICVRSERRQRCSAFRIKSLIDAGITFDLLAKVLNVSDLETSDFNYKIFLDNLKLNEIENLSKSSTLVTQPNSPNTLIKKINEQLEYELNIEDSSEDDN